MHAALKAGFLAVLCAAVGLVLCGGRLSSPPLASMKTPAAPSEQAAPAQDQKKQPDEVVREILGSLEARRPEVLWSALPASYQRDLTAIVQTLAKELPSEVWQAAIEMLRKGPAFADAFERRLAKFRDTEGTESHKKEIDAIICGTTAVGLLLDSFQAGKLADQRFVESAELTRVGRPIADRLFESLRAELKRLPTDSPAGWLKDLHRARVELRNIGENEATAACIFPANESQPIEINLVRVEGKWIPKAIAENWTELIAAVKTIYLSIDWTEETTREARTALFLIDQYLNLGTATLKADFIEFPPDFRSVEPWAEVAGAFAQPGDLMRMLGYMPYVTRVIQPHFTVQTKQRLPSCRDKSAKPVVVVCSVPAELKRDYADIDHELARHVANCLGRNGIQVVNPDRVLLWLERNRDRNEPAQVGAEFKVDLVIQVDLKDYELREDQFRGRADLFLNVIQMSKGAQDGSVIYTKRVNSSYAEGEVNSVNEPNLEFKEGFQSQLSWSVSELLVPQTIEIRQLDRAPKDRH